MPQEDDGTGQLDHPEEISWVVFPANDDASKVVKPSEQTLDLPTTPVAAQYAAVLRGFPAARGMMRRNQLHAEALANPRVQRITVVSAVADQSLGSFGNESLLDRGFDELGFMRRSAGHVHGERKTMAVADRHDFAAFATASWADSRAPFFAELKLASMNDSLRSNFPRSRKSSASFCSSLVSSPERCHCWKRR
jgi:hypothetical protein